MEEYLKGFDEFWMVYPRHVAKRAAIRAYIRAIKVATPSDIYAGAMRYARERQGQDTQFTKHPATWLNGGCWDDEPGGNSGGGVIGALDRLEQYLAGPDDNAGGPYDIFRLPQR